MNALHLISARFLSIRIQNSDCQSNCNPNRLTRLDTAPLYDPIIRPMASHFRNILPLSMMHANFPFKSFPLGLGKSFVKGSFCL